MGALLAVVIIAYSYSLTTLLQLAGLNTPLAYVSLVPFVSLILAGVHSRPSQPEPAIHDRQTDYIVGVPLMAGRAVRQPLPPEQVVGHVLGVEDRSPDAAVLRRRGRSRHFRRQGAVAPKGGGGVPLLGVAVSLHVSPARRARTPLRPRRCSP